MSELDLNVSIPVLSIHGYDEIRFCKRAEWQNLCSHLQHFAPSVQSIILDRIRVAESKYLNHPDGLTVMLGKFAYLLLWQELCDRYGRRIPLEIQDIHGAKPVLDPMSQYRIDVVSRSTNVAIAQAFDLL